MNDKEKFTPLSMWRIFCADNETIIFLYLMHNEEISEWQFVNFSCNRIECGLYDTYDEAVQYLEELKSTGKIRDYQKI